jgi:hypothetical protein
MSTVLAHGPFGARAVCQRGSQCGCCGCVVLAQCWLVLAELLLLLLVVVVVVVVVVLVLVLVLAGAG